MAVTNFLTNSAFKVPQYAKGVELEVLKRVVWMKAASPRPDSVIVERDELQKAAGDIIYYNLALQLDRPLTVGDAPLTGNEFATTPLQDSLIIDLGRDAGAGRYPMSQQRVNFNIRELIKAQASQNYIRNIEVSFFNQLAGATYATERSEMGMQASIVAVDAGHIVRPGAVTDDESLTSSEPFSLAMVDEAVTLAKTATPAIRPAVTPWGEKFLMFIHPYQTHQLRTGSNSVWVTNWQNALAGGMIDGNPIINGSLGLHGDVLLIESNYVPLGVNSSTGAADTESRRAVLCGAGACQMAWGRFDGDFGTPRKFAWIEETRDYGAIHGISVNAVWGLKRPVYTIGGTVTTVNNIVVSTYAVAP